MFKKLISLFLSFTLIFTQPLFAQGVAQLNLGSYLSTVGSSMATDRFRPLHMRYFSYDLKADNFQLLLDKGDNRDIKESELEEKTKILMEYFQIGLSLPNDKFWVNLRPDAQDEMIDPELEKTDMGKVMLEADLQLKRDTAQATSPQTPEGKAYWDKLYKKAGELFGTENITIPTITRPWIVPGEVILRQGEDSAYIFKANMKVLLEEDYLKSHQDTKSQSHQYNFNDPRMKELNEYSTQLIRELIIPRLTKEVNSSKRYASLRQVFFSLVMARWFKDTFSGKSGQYAKLIDSHNLTNLTSKEVWDKTYYFNEYKKSFEQGEYNLKENIATPYGQVVRSYVSGGVSSAIMKNEPSGKYSNKGENSFPVAASAGYGPKDGRNDFYHIEYNGKKNGVSSALMVDSNDLYYTKNSLNDWLKLLSQTKNPIQENKHLKEIQKWINANHTLIDDTSIRSIVDKVIFCLARKNIIGREATFVTEVAANIIIDLEKLNKSMLVGFEVVNEDKFAGVILTDQDIRNILFLINEGIESFKPYLASQALRVILSRAAESHVPSDKIESLSIIRGLAELLLKPGMPEEIKTQFLKQVEGIGAIGNSQKEESLKMKKAFKDTQKALVELAKSKRNVNMDNKKGSSSIEARQKDMDSFFLEQREEMRKLEGRLWVTVKDIEKMLNEEELSGRKNRGEIDIPEGRFKGISRISNYLKTLNREGTRIKIKEGKEANEIDEIIRIITETGLRNYSPRVYRAYSGSKLLSLKGSILELEKLKKDWKTFNKAASSAMETAVSKFPAKDVGGIDFRTMNYLVQPMGSFKDLRFGLPTLTSSALERINLDEELNSMRNMVKAGMVPSAMRVKEYLAACFQKGKIEEKQDDLLVCLAEIYRLAEEENLETSPELRESLVIVDTGKFVLLPNNQKVGLS